MALAQASAIAVSAATAAAASSLPSMMRHGDQRVFDCNLEIGERPDKRSVPNHHSLVIASLTNPRISCSRLKSRLLNLWTDLKHQFDDQCAVISLLRLELVDFIERPGQRTFIGSAEHSVIEDAPVPAAKEDRRVTCRR